METDWRLGKGEIESSRETESKRSRETVREIHLYSNNKFGKKKNEECKR